MSVYSTFRPVCDALGISEDAVKGGRGQCPVHGEKAHLWISTGKRGELLLRCYPIASGIPACRTNQLVREAGLKMYHLYPDWERWEAERTGGRVAPRGNPKREVRPVSSDKKDPEKDPRGEKTLEATYRYEDVTPGGEVVLRCEVLKYRFKNGDKDFASRRPNPDFDPARPPSTTNHRYLYTTKGQPPMPLFRKPELLAALAENRDRWVLYVEGEGVVEAAVEAKFAATTNYGGVFKLKPEQAEALRDCNVMIVPDEDAVLPRTAGDPLDKWTSPGIENVRHVAKILLGVARSVYVARLPDPYPGMDLEDWWRRAPGTPEERRKALSAVLSRNKVLIKTEADLAAIKPVPYPDAVRKEHGLPLLADAAPAKAPDPAPAPAPVAASPPPSEDAARGREVAQNLSREGVAPPVPANRVAAAAFVEQATRAAIGSPGPGEDPSFRDLVDVMDGLNAVSPRPASKAEWLGIVHMALGAFQTALVASPSAPDDVRAVAVHLAAHVLRGCALVAPRPRPART